MKKGNLERVKKRGVKGERQGIKGNPEGKVIGTRVRMKDEEGEGGTEN